LISASSTNTIRQWEKEELQKASGSRGKKTAWTEEDEAVKEVLSSLPVPVISQEPRRLDDSSSCTSLFSFFHCFAFLSYVASFSPRREDERDQLTKQPALLVVSSSSMRAE